jgi:RNA polymerase sigma-70 factor (ECF subfamily)
VGIAVEQAEHGETLLRIYDDALPRVFGYLRNRCESHAAAEELTSETFLAAVAQIRKGLLDDVSVAWLIGIARHKLLDHWRRGDSRSADSFDPAMPPNDSALQEDPWDAVLDQHRVAVVLAQLGAHHRSALTLRYLDGLPVAAVAETLGRTLHATEALLVRARLAFRGLYEGSDQ